MQKCAKIDLSQSFFTFRHFLRDRFIFGILILMNSLAASASELSLSNINYLVLGVGNKQFNKVFQYINIHLDVFEMEEPQLAWRNRKILPTDGHFN